MIQYTETLRRTIFMFSLFKRRIPYPNLDLYYKDCLIIWNFDGSYTTVGSSALGPDSKETCLLMPDSLHCSLYYNKGKLKGMRVSLDDDYIDVPVKYVNTPYIPLTITTSKPTFVNGFIFIEFSEQQPKEDYLYALYCLLKEDPKLLGDRLLFMPMEKCTNNEYISVVGDYNDWFFIENKFYYVFHKEWFTVSIDLPTVTSQEKDFMERDGYIDCFMERKGERIPIKIRSDGLYIFQGERVFLDEKDKLNTKTIKIQRINQSFVTEIDSVEYGVNELGLVLGYIRFKQRSLFASCVTDKVVLPDRYLNGHRIHKGDKALIGFDSTRATIYSIFSTKKESAFPFPNYCPSCDTKLNIGKFKDGNTYRFCNNYQCRDVAKHRLKQSLPLFGFSNHDNFIDKLYQNKVYDIADLLSLNKEKATPIEEDKENTKIYERILRARELPMSYFLITLFSSFTNREVDTQAILKLTKQIDTFKDIEAVEREDLEKAGFDKGTIDICFVSGEISFGNYNTLLNKLIYLEDDETIRPLYHL